MINNILLASHGTVGACAAEQATFDLCSSSTCITHLYVVPNLWRHILADDWLNNQITQERFGHYLESELQQEAEKNISRVNIQVENLGARYKHKIFFGDPQKCLLYSCSEGNFDIVITGSPRPKFKSGLRSRMMTKSLARNITFPHLQIPYPRVEH